MLVVMGKAARRERRDGSAPAAIGDALGLLDAVQVVASAGGSGGAGQLARVAAQMLACWDQDRVVLRLDPAFVAAVGSSSPDAPIGDAWLRRFPFRSVALRLVEPVEVDDGAQVCRYLGCVVVGVRSRVGGQAAFTSYVPIPEADGVRALWVFEDRAGGFGAQTLTPFVRAADGAPDAAATIGALVAAMTDVYRTAGTSLGAEVAVLAPLTVTVLAYLASRDPDVVRVVGPGAGVSRSPRVREVAEVGWRVGAALRAERSVVDRGAGAGGGGWRLAPHIRAAHFHRVRVATRAADGTVTGSRAGVEGVDWRYELRWYPPTPVATDRSKGPVPVVRNVPGPTG
jgi:hypothetical protein